MKIVVAGIVAGVVVFIWSFVEHTVLSIGRMGVSSLPNEDAIVAVMKQSIHEPGFYFFPGMDMSKKPTPEEEKAWQAKYTAGPTGVLVYQPKGGQVFSPRQLAVELLSDIAAALVAGLVLAQISGGLGMRAFLVALFGLFGWLSITVSYWNWYGFPGAFSLGEAIDQVVGWFLGGVVLAAMVKRPQA